MEPSDNVVPVEAEAASLDPDEHKAPVGRLVNIMANLGIALLDAAELSKRFPENVLHPPELSRLRESNGIIAVRWRGYWRYPSFQFSAVGSVLPRITELLGEIGSGVPGWVLLDWLVHEQPLLEKRPIDGLPDSCDSWDRVVQAARERFDDSTGLE